ncbi:MAG: galactose mutarotase, partial [Terracoccus sp.]
MNHVPSGRQFEIANGEQRAVIVEVGGGIRAYDVGGVEVLEPYAVDQMCDGAHGAPLVPWPNRLSPSAPAVPGAAPVGTVARG